MLTASGINLRHLRAFVAVCDRGGISAAAADVHLSQPAITQAIAKLERDFDARLFQRNNQGMFATEAAKVLLDRTRRAFENLALGAARSGRKTSSGAEYLQAVTSTQLRALIAVAAHGNYSVAARALNLSQPSLHRAARDLEALSEQQLFVKSPQGIRLTPAAERLAQAARLAFSELEHAIEELSDLSGAQAGLLRLGSLPLSLGTLLPEVLNRITTERPKLGVSVVDAPFSELLFGLRNGEIDLMLGALRDPDPAPDVVQVPLFNDQLCVVCAPTHPLAQQERVTKEKLTQYPWVVARSETPTRAHFEQFFGDCDTSAGGSLIESNSMILVRHILQGSQKLAMISLTQAREHIRAGVLARLPIDLGDTPRIIGLSHRRNWRPTRAQNLFIQIAKEVSHGMQKTTSS